MDISDGRKRCGRCKEVKPLSEFHRDATGKHGVRSVCKTCAKAVAAAYRQANRAEIAAYSALYHQANRAEIAARKAAYRRANPEKVTAQQAAYHRTHPHVCWEREYRSRCRTYGLTPVIEPFTRDDVVSRYGETCVLCGTAPFEELDHHIPIGAWWTAHAGQRAPDVQVVQLAQE